VDLWWSGSPLTVTLQNDASGEVVASITGVGPASRLAYTIPSAANLMGYFWTVTATNGLGSLSTVNIGLPPVTATQLPLTQHWASARIFLNGCHHCHDGRRHNQCSDPA
jgi:hypothetical protein